ncbi:aspartate/glutamate racemase family protein [Microbacterium sp. NPDC055521]
MTKILWINPLGSDEFDLPIADALAIESDARIDVASLSEGPRNLDYNSSAAVVAKETLGVIRWAEEESYDAAIIGCFYDPYLRAAREITTNLVVAAPAESSLRLASTLGESYSVLVGSRKNVPEMHENVVRYGHENKLASFRVLGIGVNGYQGDLETTARRMFEEARAAVEEDRADAIVLGCTAQFGLYRELQEELQVPVIDSAVAALRYVEFLVDARDRNGWRVSKASGFEAPPSEDLQQWIPPVRPERLMVRSEWREL